MAEGIHLTEEQRFEYFQTKDKFITNACILFDNATKLVESLWSDRHEDHTHTLEKMLHSILFMGHLHDSIYSPGEIFNEEEILNETMETFPKAFAEYQTHVPLRTPFSYFLELVVLLCGETNAAKVKQELYKTLKKCEKAGDRYPLISTVMCICKSGGSRYYGASLSCEDGKVRDIMTSVSCVNVWHSKVSSVVTPAIIKRKIRHNIKLPDSVNCTAYTVENKEVKIPCKSCVKLYSLPEHSDPTASTSTNAPGNCAETEAISNLLKVDETCHITGGTYDEHVMKEKIKARFSKKVAAKMETRTENKSMYTIDMVFD